MPRKPRILADGHIYHVLNRGNDKKKIFHTNGDYAIFINLIERAKGLFPVKIYAYCLMPNHYHFVMSSDKAINISKFVHWLATSHAHRYHKYYGTTGHIWEGRYKSFMVQQDSYLLMVLRYVEANPVRGGLVISAKDWEWSSLRQRIKLSDKSIIDQCDISLPNNWADYINEPLNNYEIKKLRKSVIRQRPYGEKKWQLDVGNKFGLISTLRSQGRPKITKK